ncbi:hypothetical protein NNO_1002 [Hydrogenimonas sp.]|nr:hypothetical protein NNO_1002 [Hydrogenimonas sp.]
MLTHYLKKAIEDLEFLIDLTLLDIADIKSAHHDRIFERLESKEDRIASFEKHKGMIDSEIALLLKENCGKELSDLLDEKTQEGLERLRETLNNLHSLNRYYARFVIAVGEFYNSMYEEVFPIEKDGYTGKTPKTASLIELRV